MIKTEMSSMWTYTCYKTKRFLPDWEQGWAGRGTAVKGQAMVAIKAAVIGAIREYPTWWDASLKWCKTFVKSKTMNHQTQW